LLVLTDARLQANRQKVMQDDTKTIVVKNVFYVVFFL